MTKSEIIKTAALLTAIDYVASPAHADWYLFPVTRSASAGAHGSARRLWIAKVSREDLLDVLRTEKALETGWLKIRDNVLKVNKISESALRKTFGSRVMFQLLTEYYKTYSDLPHDPSPCAGPRARTFEKLACKSVGAKWCGSLRNVQVDGTIKYIDEDGNIYKVRYEVKGLGGRITAFVPSAVDNDQDE